MSLQPDDHNWHYKGVGLNSLTSYGILCMNMPVINGLQQTASDFAVANQNWHLRG